MNNNVLDYSIFNKFYDNINRGFWEDYQKKCLKILSDSNLKKGLVYDFGCGTGLGIELIKKLGYQQITGIDLSPDMIDIAKSKYSDVNFLVGDMSNISSLKPGVLAICNFDAINYLIGDRDWVNFFSIVSNSLKEGGVFLFDTLTENDHKNNWPNSTRVIENPDYMLISHGEYKSKIAYMHYVWFVKDKNNVYKKYTETHKQRTYSMEQIEKWLNDNNLKIVKVIDADNSATPSKETIRLIYKCIKY